LDVEGREGVISVKSTGLAQFLPISKQAALKGWQNGRQSGECLLPPFFKATINRFPRPEIHVTSSAGC
jgi:hypothetical protein